MGPDSKKRFLIFHFLFLLSLVSIYFIPHIYPLVNERFLPPVNRYLRFYIIGVFSLTFIFYYLTLSHYIKLDAPLLRRSRLGIYFWASTLSVLLFLCTSRALLSHDLFEYSLRSRMITLYGLNPYIHTPMDIKNDIFFPHAIWKRYTECYGPLWVLLGIPHTFIARDSFLLSRFLHKLVLFSFFVPSAFVFFKLAGLLKLDRPGLTALAFFLNPTVIIMTLIDGHNEIVMVFFFLLALYFLLAQRQILGLFMLAMAINIKFIYTLSIPLFIIYIILNNKSKLSALIKLAAGFVFSAAFTLLVSFPFGKEMLPSLIKYYSELNRNFWYDSIPYAVYFLVSKAGIVVSKDLIGTIFSVIFIIIYGYLLHYFITRTKYDRQAIFTSISLIILALLLTNYTQFETWYLLWVIPLILLSRIRHKFIIFLSLSFFLSLTFWKRMSVLAIPMMILLYLLFRFKSLFSKKLVFLYDFSSAKGG